MKPRPVRIAWNKFANIPLSGKLESHLDPAEYRRFADKAHKGVHPCYHIDNDIFVELPAPDWGTGDLLIYCADKGWLVRRNYVDHWYVDIGFFRQVDEDVYSWTDLWLDVATPSSGRSYQLLDSGEFGHAIADGLVSRNMAAYALSSLDDLVGLFHDGSFPTQEIARAEQTAIELGR